MYDDPIMTSSPPPPASPDKQNTYVTQPTQPLPAHFAADVTQPTQLLTPKAHRTLDIELGTSPHMQVPRSSPGPDRLSSPAPPSQSHQTPRPYAFNPMAPPGTGFFPPQAVRKPVFDLTSDDAPVERDPDEDESSFRSNIPLSKVEIRTAKVDETPPKPTWDLSGYAYKVVQQAARKRGSDGLHSQSPPAKKARPAQRQGGPSRAMPVAIDLTRDDDVVDDVVDDLKLEDISDWTLRRKTERLMAIFSTRSIRELYNALVLKKGNHEDASAYLAEQDSDAELLKSPQIGVAKRSASIAEPKKTAQRGLKAPVKSLMDKYSKQALSYNTPSATASPTTTDVEQPKKRRLIRGRRNLAPESGDEPTTPPRPQTKDVKQASAPVEVSDDENEGIVAISDDDSDAGAESDKNHKFSESSLVDFFNTCSVEAMVDLSGHKEEDISKLLEERPFKSLDAIRKIHVDPKAQEEKGKKKPRKPRITSGTRLVEAAMDMWDAYSTIDSVVKQCEGLGKPMVAGMARWGINIFGASTDGEVDAVTLDDSSDTSSTRDSGYHTPKSGHGSDNESDLRKTSSRIKLLKQPAIMNDDIELKDYQVVGLNWLNLLWQNGISGILADDMGLGKTCQVIAFLSHLKEQGQGRPTLIIVPGSTLENWCREFERFSSKVNFTPYYGSQAERFESQDTIRDNIETGNCDVIITTYDLAYRKEDNTFLRKCKPQICIFDEGHVLKNANTARYKSLMRITPKCRILLTGTPLQNSLQELMSILGFLMPDVFYDKQDESVQEMLQVLFKHKAKVTESDSHSTLLSAQRIQRARTMLTPFILRRKKAQVLKHLPKKTCRVEYCDLTDTQKTLYNEQLQKQRKILLDRAAGLPVKDHANVMMKLRQAAIHPLLFRHRYTDDKIRKMSKACLREDTFAESDPDIIYEELQLYQDYQCHHLALKYPSALKKFELKDAEWMDSGKVQTLISLLKKYKANGDRALVFSQFTSVMDILGWVFDDHDIPFMRMDGSTPIAERQGLMDEFHADTSIPVFMLSTKSGGAGINLACANKVIIFDSSFNPQDDIQAENRAHRVGQTREVEVVRLVTRNTVEEQIFALGVSKLELDKLVQGDDDDAAGPGRKKKGVVAGSGAATPALSKAEEAGMGAVEAMLLQQLATEGKGDVKDLFKQGLEDAGVSLAA